MALLNRAVRLLGPAHLAPRWHADVTVSQVMDGVPDWVWHDFLVPLRSFEPLVADSPEHKMITGALTHWRQDRPGAVALLGTFGAGKTSLLHRIQVTLRDLPVAHHRFASRILGQNQLLQQLADSLGLPPGNLDDLAAHLQAGPEQAILLDDCHLLFLRRPGGFAPLDLLLRLVRTTGRHILWITAWNVYSWIYLEYLYRLSDHFAVVHNISPQSQAEMQQMLLARLRQINLEVTWPADQEDAIFQTIWTRARGRPALAQHIFLRSLATLGDGRFALHSANIYRPPQQCQVKDGEETYALGSLIRHGMLTARELASINHISEAHAAAILARTTASGLTMSLEPDFRLNPIHTDAIVAYLDSRRAISFREVQAV
ncbi:MAG: hypothetical protein ACE5HA_13785 [Anaerolineae bacterium]